MELSKRNTQSDILGTLSSGLCAIHCTLTPLLLIANPVLESVTDVHGHGEGLWWLIDYLFLGLSFLAVWYSAKNSTNATIRKVLWAAWLLFFIGVLSEAFHYSYALWFIYIGSIGLIIAHIQNYRYCLKCNSKTY
jgi:hypothetical protein